MSIELHRASRRGRGWVAIRRHGPVVLFYTIIALVFTYPTMWRATAAIGGQQDALENYWNLWWVRWAVTELGHNPLQTSHMFHPFGLPLYFHTLNLLNGLLSLPIQACCGVAAAYNALNLFAVVVASLGMYALVLHLTRRQSAAMIAGLVYAFNPYVNFHLYMGQTNLVALQWMPLYLLALLKGLHDRWIFLPLAGLLLVLNALTDWHYVIFLLVVTGVVAVYEALRLRRTRALLTLTGKLAVVGAVFAVAISPVLVPMLLELRSDPSARRSLDHSILHSTDLLAFLLPSPFHPLWGDWAGTIFFERLVQQGTVGGIANIGLVAVVLGFYGAVRDWRRGLLFAAMLLAGALLALGPYLQVNGTNSGLTEHPVPMPYLLFYQLPFMNILRIPSRFVAVVMLALAALTGLGLACLWHHPLIGRRSGTIKAALIALLAMLVLFEYWPRPMRMTPIGPELVSPFYHQLGNDPEAYAILDVPYSSPRSPFYQTYHHKPTVGGRIARPKQHPWFNARFFGPLIQSRAPEAEVGADNSAASWRAALACQNIRYVVFYKDVTEEEAQGIAALQQELFADVAPAYEDTMLRAYGPLRDQAPEPYWTPTSHEWYPAETNETELTYRWIQGERGTLLAYPCGHTATTMRFTAFGYAQPRTLEIRLNGELVQTVALPQETLVPVEIPLTLRNGENRIELRSVEPAVSPSQRGAANDDRRLSVNVSDVSFRP